MKIDIELTNNGSDYSYYGNNFVCHAFVNRIKSEAADNIRLRVSSTAPKSKGWKKIKMILSVSNQSSWFYVWISGKKIRQGVEDTLVYYTAANMLKNAFGKQNEYVFWAKVENLS